MRMTAAVAVLLLLAGGLLHAKNESSSGSELPEGAITFGVFADAGAVDALVSDHLYVKGGIVLVVTDGFVLDMPVTVVFDRSGSDINNRITLLDIGLLLKYYPGNLGFWTGLSLFQGVNFIGDNQPEQRYHYMTEIALGYTFNLPFGLYIEPSVIFRDPLKTFHDSLDYIQDYVPGYGDFRICLNLGWLFWTIS
ncbi:MAG: hypothetical protein HQ557_00375 [Bacteroidetes bacterium]|nr:hypothetical protein [Bacteroidota bacterium]